VDTGVVLVHPCYIELPEEEGCYSADAQYFFGSAILAAPVWAVNETGVSAGGSSNATARNSTYLPTGSWTSWNGTEVLTGPSTLPRTFYALGDTPLWVRGGSLLPMQLPLPSPGSAAAVPGTADPLVLALWLGGSSSSYTLYEDDGDSLLEQEQQEGSYRLTQLSFSGQVLQRPVRTVTVGAAQGSYPGAPSARNLTLQLRGALGVMPMAVTANGVAIPPRPAGQAACSAPCFYVVEESQHSLCAPAGTAVVEAGRFSVDAEVVLTVEG